VLYREIEVRLCWWSCATHFLHTGFLINTAKTNRAIITSSYAISCYTVANVYLAFKAHLALLLLVYKYAKSKIIKYNLLKVEDVSLALARDTCFALCITAEEFIAINPLLMFQYQRIARIHVQYKHPTANLALVL